MPTCYTDRDTGKTHESVLRAYQILAKTKDMLHRNVDPVIILEMIALMEVDIIQAIKDGSLDASKDWE